MAKLAVGWTNPDMTLFHGTTQGSATSILAGVSIASTKPRPTDFGQGFYTTTSEPQARNWANKKGVFSNQRNPLAPPETPAVVEFTIPRDDLAGLEAIWFVRGDVAATDYWNFVRHFRRGVPAGKHHQRTGPQTWYDLAIGPVAASWMVTPRILPDMDQISFHTTTAVNLLNALPAHKRRQLP
jgi:hypothetical protein